MLTPLVAKPPMRLVERRRHVAHAEDEGGDDRAVARRRRRPARATSTTKRVVLCSSSSMSASGSRGRRSRPRARRRSPPASGSPASATLRGGARRVGLGDRLEAELAHACCGIGRAPGRGCAPLDGQRAWRPAAPSAGGGSAGNARRRCGGRIRAADGGCRRRGPRPSSRSGSWRARRRPPFTAAKASSKVAQGSGSRSG